MVWIKIQATTTGSCCNDKQENTAVLDFEKLDDNVNFVCSYLLKCVLFSVMLKADSKG